MEVTDFQGARNIASGRGSITDNYKNQHSERYTYRYIVLLSQTVAGTKGDRYKCTIRWCSRSRSWRRMTVLHSGIRLRLGHSWVLSSHDKGRRTTYSL